MTVSTSWTNQLRKRTLTESNTTGNALISERSVQICSNLTGSTFEGSVLDHVQSAERLAQQHFYAVVHVYTISLSSARSLYLPCQNLSSLGHFVKRIRYCLTLLPLKEGFLRGHHQSFTCPSLNTSASAIAFPNCSCRFGALDSFPTVIALILTSMACATDRPILLSEQPKKNWVNSARLPVLHYEG